MTWAEHLNDGSDPSAVMRRAIDLAERGVDSVLPNPVVGCVIIDNAGNMVGEGWHQRYGQAHAEVNALAMAQSRAAGGTAYVTLEPCHHTGKTGPCTAALIAAKVARVVVAVADPNPVASGGIEALRAAGIEVSVGLLAAEAEDVNRVWLHTVRKQRPFVTWKAGMTVDGRVAAADGTSKWITSAQSREDVHRLRSRIDTILVGAGTVLADDPHLTVRHADGSLMGSQPLRVVVDSIGRTPASAKVFDDAAPTWIATSAEVGANAQGSVDLVALLDMLFARGQRHVLVEGGPLLATSFWDAGLVDEAIVYVAPLVLGAGKSALDGGLVQTLAQGHHLQLRQVTQIADDVRLRYSVG